MLSTRGSHLTSVWTPFDADGHPSSENCEFSIPSSAICCAGDFSFMSCYSSENLSPVGKITPPSENTSAALRGSAGGRHDTFGRVCRVNFHDCPGRRAIATGGKTAWKSLQGHCPVIYLDLESRGAAVCTRHSGEIWGIACIPSTPVRGPRIVSASWNDPNIRVSDPVEGKEVGTFHNPDGYGLRVFQEDEWEGQVFVGSGFSGCSVYRFGLERGEVEQFRGHENWVDGISASVLDKLLFSSGWDKTARVWSMNDRRCQHVIRLQFEARSCCFDERRRSLFVGLIDGSIAQYDIRLPTERFASIWIEEDSENHDICQIDEDRFVSGGTEELVMWSPTKEGGEKGGKILQRRKTHQKRILGICVLRDDDFLSDVEAELMEERISYLIESVLNSGKGECIEIALQNATFRMFLSSVVEHQ